MSRKNHIEVCLIILIAAIVFAGLMSFIVTLINKPVETASTEELQTAIFINNEVEMPQALVDSWVEKYRANGINDDWREYLSETKQETIYSFQKVAEFKSESQLAELFVIHQETISLELPSVDYDEFIKSLSDGFQGKPDNTGNPPTSLVEFEISQMKSRGNKMTGGPSHIIHDPFNDPIPGCRACESIQLKTLNITEEQ